MSLAHRSVATIKSPQFINLTPLDINPLMSACEIKVFYIGENRNKSFISKEVATQMAKTLRGAPIVGYYRSDKEDFSDHGEEITIDGDGVHFKNNTRPYGFVAPDAKVWFKDFEEEDDFGNSIIRTYLMTTGYLWQGQFEQAKKVYQDDGKPHSMELDKKTLKGHWATNPKNNMEFFIINDAIFEKLCILGDEVEPCFQGSGVTAPEVSATFSLDENFKHTLFTMMEELKYALEGGNTMVKVTEPVKETEVTTAEPEVTTQFTENQVNENESSSSEQAPTSDFKKDDEEDKKEKENPSENKDDKKDEDNGGTSDDKEEDSADEEKEDDKDKKKKFTVLEQEYNELQSSYTSLKEEVEELRTFKKKIEDKEKDELIERFYMLSDEDKKDVIEHKSEYSLEEIESKLALIGYRKGVNFNLDTSSENEESKEEEQEDTPVVTFDVKATEDSTVPEWVRAVESAMNRY